MADKAAVGVSEPSMVLRVETLDGGVRLRLPALHLDLSSVIEAISELPIDHVQKGILVHAIDGTETAMLALSLTTRIKREK